jgi:hypothetical protein
MCLLNSLFPLLGLSGTLIAEVFFLGAHATRHLHL